MDQLLPLTEKLRKLRCFWQRSINLRSGLRISGVTIQAFSILAQMTAHSSLLIWDRARLFKRARRMKRGWLGWARREICSTQTKFSLVDMTEWWSYGMRGHWSKAPYRNLRFLENRYGTSNTQLGITGCFKWGLLAYMMATLCASRLQHLPLWRLLWRTSPCSLSTRAMNQSAMLLNTWVRRFCWRALSMTIAFN